MADKKYILRNGFIKKRFTVKKGTSDTSPINHDSPSAAEKVAEEMLKNGSNMQESKAHFKENHTDKLDRRAKRAAYLKAHAERDISVSYSETFDENVEYSTDNVQSPVGTDVTDETQETEKIENRFLENTEYVNENNYRNSLEDENVRKAYKVQLAEKMAEKRKQSFRDTVAVGAEFAVGYVGVMKSGDAVGMITHPTVSVIKNEFGGAEFLDEVSVVSGTVQNSDSVGGAVANIGVDFAKVRAKSAALSKIHSYSDNKSVGYSDKEYYHTDRKSDSSTHKDDSMNTDISNALEKRLDKADRSKEKYREKLSEHRKEMQRKQQKGIYIKHNKTKADFVGNTTKQKMAKKAANSKLLLMGAGGPAMLVVVIIIILLMIIASLFSWMSPYDYSLAGDESEDPNVEAKTEEEILEGYALMIQNYMDVSQAYYYLVYGDWFGGTYMYPAPNIPFSSFLSQYTAEIVNEIQARFSEYFAQATSPQQMQAIANAMSAEIQAAVKAAEKQAKIEYDRLMEELDDSMSADTKRLHYEVLNGGGGNGIKDSAEFTGMPIVGTNHFDEYEINSELSAEELLAMSALYKSFLTMGNNESETENGETEENTDVYNITPQDIMAFFKETEFIKITAEITTDNACGGNCKRELKGDYETGYFWEYYCDEDHYNLIGRIEPCKTKDELFDKIIEVTNAENNGVDKEDCEKIYESYIEFLHKELDITEADYRQFGSADNTRAKEFYNRLISGNEIPNNYWIVETPLPNSGESEENADEQNKEMGLRTQG